MSDLAIIALATVTGLATHSALSRIPLQLAPTPAERCEVDVLFSPNGGITDRIVQEIDCANKSITVQAYSFTSRPILEALLRAKAKGVQIQVCADDSNKNPDTSICDELADAGVVVYLDARHAISHSKTMVIDGELVIEGSFNFTAAAEKSNLENCNFVHSRAFAARYSQNFEDHRSHCIRLVK